MVCIILNLVIDIMNLHVSINIVLYLLLKSVVGMKKLVKNKYYDTKAKADKKIHFNRVKESVQLTFSL